MKDSLPDVFRKLATGFIEDSGAYLSDCRLTSEGGSCELFIPKTSDEGFALTVIADDAEVTVYSDMLAHVHHTSEGNHEEVSGHALGLVRDLLSPAMRLHVHEIAGKPARAHFEIFSEGKWHQESTTGLFRLPFFRKRTERFFTNHRFAARDNPIYIPDEK